MAEEKKELSNEELEMLAKARELAAQATGYTLDDVETQEAEEAKARGGNFVKIPFYAMRTPKTYKVRMLPLKPVGDNIQKGFSYPVHKMVVSLSRAGAKPKNVNITRPDYAGIDGDIGRYFRNAVLRIADETKDKKLKEEVNHGMTGVKYKSRELMYVIDADDRIDEKGEPMIQLLELSYTQSTEVKSQVKTNWDDANKDGEVDQCPISRINKAYTLNIIKSGSGLDTKYSFTLSRKNNDSLSEAELIKWVGLPTIPVHAYTYTRYQHEALLAFLKQWEDDHGLSITSETGFIELNEHVLSQIPATDTSHFAVNEGDSDNKEVGSVQLESLVEALDLIIENGLDERESDEAGKLRSDIGVFIEENELITEISRDKSNKTLLDDVIAEIQEKAQSQRDAAPATKGRKRS